MSRSGYSDDCENWDLIRWRGAVKSAIRGNRGQRTLKEIADALDAMPKKELAAGSLVTADGEFCTLGVLGCARSLDMAGIDPDDREAVANAFGIAEALAAEIMYLNDEYIDDWKWIEVEICGPVRPGWPDWGRKTQTVRVHNDKAPAERWKFMRNWVSEQIQSRQHN